MKPGDLVRFIYHRGFAFLIRDSDGKIVVTANNVISMLPGSIGIVAPHGKNRCTFLEKRDADLVFVHNVFVILDPEKWEPVT